MRANQFVFVHENQIKLASVEYTNTDDLQISSGVVWQVSHVIPCSC